MKKLGIIGGAGPLASSLFYETLALESYKKKIALPEVFLVNYPFHRGLTFSEREKNHKTIKEELLYCVKILEKNEATVAVLVCNTLHLELAKLKQDTIDFRSIPKLVLEEMRGNRFLLLATQNTCRSFLYDQKGLEIIRPSQEMQKQLDEIINHVLEGTICTKDAETIEEIIAFFSKDIDGVILGCTDLPVLHHHIPLRSFVPIYDSVKIPAKKILRIFYEENKKI